MKFFGWKSAGRDGSRPVLSRGFSTWSGANSQGEWPRAYEPQVHDGYIGNPVAQRAVRLVSDGVGSAPVTASDAVALALVSAKSGGQSLVETMALQLLLHGNAYVQVLTDTDGIVEGALARSAAMRTRARVTLPWRSMILRPGDAVRVADADWRIAGTRFERMAVELDIVRTGGAVATTTAEPGRSLVQPDAPHGATILELVDLPPLSDVAATRPVLGVFATGVSSGWRRAALLSSIDGGATFESAGGTGLPATMGLTATMLPTGPSALIDRTSSVEVELEGSWMVLGDADETALLAGTNRAMIGDELIQFGRATALSPTRWRLNEFWRGRRGTEDKIVAHPIGSRFVRIDSDSAVILPADQAVAGVRVMAAGIGDSEPYPMAVAATAGRAMLPVSPVHVSATLLASGDTELRWIRRSREGWAWRDAVEVPLAEEQEAYRVVRTTSAGSVVADTGAALFTYTSAMRLADVASGASNVSFVVMQVGATGVSPPAMLTLSLI